MNLTNLHINVNAEFQKSKRTCVTINVSKYAVSEVNKEWAIFSVVRINNQCRRRRKNIR